MRLFIASEQDVAGMCIRGKLLAMAEWREEKPFEGTATYSLGDIRLLAIRQEHLYRDNIDKDAAKFFGEKPDVVTYLSKHRSESMHRSLTVHPIGNHRQADFGGRPETLVPSAPIEMTAAMRALGETAAGLDYTVSFEATHHGPYLETPTFFIESGSDEVAWKDEKAAEAIAAALLKTGTATGKTGIGVGGGHYMPRITDVALSRDVCFGHMIPSHALSEWKESVFENALFGTKGAEFVYFHRKAMNKAMLRRAEEWFLAREIKVVREEDLPLLQGIKTF